MVFSMHQLWNTDRVTDGFCFHSAQRSRTLEAQHLTSKIRADTRMKCIYTFLKESLLLVSLFVHGSGVLPSVWRSGRRP